MNNIKKITLPLSEKHIKELKAGDILELTGIIYTGRDAAHKRLVELLDNNKELPIVSCISFVCFCHSCNFFFLFECPTSIIHNINN